MRWFALTGARLITPATAQTAFVPREESPQEFAAGMPPLDDKDRETVVNYLETACPPRAPAGRGGWVNRLRSEWQSP
ncbi:hypothetical protein [Bradyrhizobium roseum]|uniref:hypothetical protein n=1 Tax=Bradyrhizobium roseum TaxID=3056648 RepID=UPI002638F05A|nr:hypothetical protein [Bradyrhizobium roseus]WKA26670.1 hypothetical protein QUH67_24205 [Bradyrhizobium roseus]